MKILRFAFNTLSWLLCFTVAANAGPIAAAVGILAKVFTASFLFKAILGIALNVGISLLQRARAKKEQEKQARENAGVQVQLQGGGAVPLTIPFGFTATAGNLEYVGVWGAAGKTPNAYLHMVISLADMPIESLVGVIVNGRRHNIGTTPYSVGGDLVGYPIAGFTKNGANYLWIHFYDGTQTVADPLMRARFGGNARPWTANHIGRGIPYVVITARYDETLFASGLPQFIFEILGVKLYDVSKDSTAGGSGTQRWNTPSTWAYTDNAIVVAYNVIRGMYYGSQWMYGGQNMAAALLPSANWIAGISEAARLIPLSAGAGGGNERQFRCGGTIEVDVQPLETVRNLLVASNSRLTELGGKFKVLCGAPGAAVASITDESIVITEGQSLDPFKSLEETFNGIHATYPERDQNWEMYDAPPRYYPAFEAIDDGRRLVADTQFVFVPFKYQVQRLMNAMIQDNRRMIVHQITLPPWAYALEPNDVISWTSVRNGYSAKKFLIVGITGAPTYNQTLQITEIDPSDYDWNTGLELESPLGDVGPIDIAVQSATGFQVFPSTFADADGVDRRPTIEVRMDGDLDDVISVQIQVRLEATGDLVFDVTLPYGNPDLNANPKSIVLNGTFLPNTEYEVRCKLIPITPRDTDWTAWLPVTTPDVRLGANDLYPIDVGDLVADLGDWQEWIGDSLRDAQDQLDEVDAQLASLALSNQSNIQQVRQELSSIYDDAVATFTSEITTATGPGSALAQRLDQYDVSLGTKASISALQSVGLVTTNSGGAITGIGTAITSITASLPSKADITALQSIGVVTTDDDGEISGVGTAITGIQALINGVTADATFRAQAGYTPGAGYTARIGLEARISTSATYRSAGIFIDVTAATARVVLTADQVAIFAGGTIAALFDAGTAYIATARIRNLDSDNIRTKSLNADTVLIDGTLITDIIAANAVNRISSATLGSQITLAVTWTNIISVVASAAIAGSRMVIHVFVKTLGLDTGGFGLRIRLLRNGTQIFRYDDITTAPNDYDGCFIHIDAPGAGSHTYTVQMQRIESQAAYCRNAVITVTETKR